MAEFFGFNITKSKPKSDPKQNFSTPQAEDGTQVVAAGGHFASHLDMEGSAILSMRQLYQTRTNNQLK
jgi:hypothetical protein